MNHIMCGHYGAVYGCGKCLKDIFLSSQQLKTHLKVCMGFPKGDTPSSSDKEPMPQGAQESSQGSLCCHQCSEEKSDSAKESCSHKSHKKSKHQKTDTPQKEKRDKDKAGKHETPKKEKRDKTDKHKSEKSRKK